MQTLVSQQYVSISKLVLSDAETTFDVTVVEAPNPARLLLFAVGGGGDPERHLPLLESLARQGCTVVAPHFERLAAPFPTDEDLLLRARRLKLALDWAWRPGRPTTGVGHSIGAAILLALAGGQIWTPARQKLAIDPDARLSRLVLLTPVAAFFQAPGALNAVQTPIQAWPGARTPSPRRSRSSPFLRRSWIVGWLSFASSTAPAISPS